MYKYDNIKVYSVKKPKQGDGNCNLVMDKLENV